MCDVCGNNFRSYFKVQFYFLPSRLVRKRHKSEERSLVHCTVCFEKQPSVSISIKGRDYGFGPSAFDETARCPGCGEDAFVQDRIYGLLTVTFIAHDSIVENGVLATFCAKCVGADTHLPA